MYKEGMNIFRTFAYTLFLSAFLSFASPAREMAKDALKAIAHEMNNAFDLYPLEIKRCVYPDIQKLSIVLQSYKPLEQEECSVLMNRVMNRALHIIHEQKSMRPFLQQYPFPKENIQIEVRFLTKDITPVPIGMVSKMLLKNGEVQFYLRTSLGDKLFHSIPAALL